MANDPSGSGSSNQICGQQALKESSDDRRRRWANLLRSHHYEPVIFDVLSDELPKYTTSRVVDPIDIVTHMRECALILASAPRIFFAAIGGNLVSRMKTDADLQAEYAVIQQRAHHQPSIYIHLLADDGGQPPSPKQYLMIRDMLLDYLCDCPSTHAHHIDNITAPLVTLQASTQGHRKYLSTPAISRSPKRVATLTRLTTGIATRCSQVPFDMHNAALSHPPAEVGYALNAHKRLAQHRARQSSNYVMNLVEDICSYMFRTKMLANQFKMHQYIIYLIFRPSQAAIAEIFCSGLMQCWVEEGGFNAYPAGRSVASSRTIGAEEWEVYKVLAREGSLLDGNMEVLRERAEQWQKALNWEDENERKSVTGEDPKMADDDMDVT